MRGIDVVKCRGALSHLNALLLREYNIIMGSRNGRACYRSWMFSIMGSLNQFYLFWQIDLALSREAT